MRAVAQLRIKCRPYINKTQHQKPTANGNRVKIKQKKSKTGVEMSGQNPSMSSLASQICNQIASTFSNSTAPYTPPLDVMVAELVATADQNGRIFLYGVGREGLMMKALCMRLYHLGLSAHSVFDVTAPPISSAADLLVASAGTGGYPTVDAICSVARSHGARVLLLTAQPESGSCVKHATAVAYLPAQTMANDGGGQSRQLMPMGSAYEGSMFVLFELVVYRLGEVLGQAPDAVRSRHTNLL